LFRRLLVILLVKSFRGGFERFDRFWSDFLKFLPDGLLAIRVPDRAGLRKRLRSSRLSERQSGETGDDGDQESLRHNLAHNFSPGVCLI
jgi:hypothetical protein